MKTTQSPQPLASLDSFDMKRPQVMLDVHVFDVSRTFARAIGINWPLQFQAINVGAAALAALGSGTNLQTLINQLISSGGINQGNSTAISALLAQSQNSSLSQLLSTPFATFGGGKTLFAVPVPPATASFSLKQSDIRELDHVSLRGRSIAAHYHAHWQSLPDSECQLFSYLCQHGDHSSHRQQELCRAIPFLQL